MSIMSPDTKFILDDQSYINVNTAIDSDNVNRPVFMTVFSSDKGPEKLQKKLSGKKFFALYGDNPNFFNHGQPLLQAANIANAGGLQYCKRVVAPDSKLAHIALIANVTSKQVQKTNAKGKPLYSTTTVDETYWKEVETPADTSSISAYVAGTEYTIGTIVSANSKYYKAVQAITADNTAAPGASTTIETTDPITGGKSNDKVMVDAANVKYSLTAVKKEDQVNDTSDIDSVFKFVTNKLYTDKDKSVEPGEGKNYVLMAFTDTGRGISNKRIKIYADESRRKPVLYSKYVFKVIENSDTLETFYFTLDTDIVESADGTTANAKNKGIQQVINLGSSNIKCKFYDTEMEAFVKDVSEKSGLTSKEVLRDDILFGNDRYGVTLNTVKIDSTGDNLNPNDGVLLINGDNGAFGESPISLLPIDTDDPENEAMTLYYNEVLKIFNGSFSDDIYDVDNTRIDVIFDANYPTPIKNAIQTLVTFREDCSFFRDYGLDLTTINSVESVNDTVEQHREVFNYMNSYDVIEPYYRKEVNVTVMYNLVSKFVDHYINGVNRPFCGIAYGITFENDIVPGTLNFTPKRTPKTDTNILTYDQKQWFCNNRINYIAYYDGVPTMDTEFTSQQETTQLSFINNVLLVQKIIHEIRIECPKKRYTFTTDSDLINYKAAVEAILNNYKGSFKSISIEYIQDDEYELNKIFYAVIKVVFKDFYQTEIFKITALTTTTNTNS